MTSDPSERPAVNEERDQDPVILNGKKGDPKMKGGYKEGLEPLVKWAGGKEKELKFIIPNLPGSFKDYYEPFVGGGAVYTSIEAERYFINDRSEELIAFYEKVKERKEHGFFEILERMAEAWDELSSLLSKEHSRWLETYKEFANSAISDGKLYERISFFLNEKMARIEKMAKGFIPFIDDPSSDAQKADLSERLKQELHEALFNKMRRMRRIEREKKKLPTDEILQNIETGFKGGYYMFIRDLYNEVSRKRTNSELRIAAFFFIRNFSYSGMFRYNKKGDFNVPYGGIAYNRKNFFRKIQYLRSKELSEHLDRTKMDCTDFEAFLKKHEPGPEDFVFLDPPYDSTFSTYAKNSFTKEDQKRLADHLKKDCRAKWMMIIKNTEFIYSLYDSDALKIKLFDKKYLVSFKNRNDKNAEHLLITNYPMDE